jgi:OFA family oxalate/formate antiporter-like MFS transporter
LYGLGVFLSSFAGESLVVLYLTYGLVVGVGLGFGYIAPIAALPGWFPDRPGLAYGIAVFGFGAGSAINVPVAEALISSTGGPLRAFGILGLAYVVLVGGAAAFLVTDLPEGPERQEPVETAATPLAWDFQGALKTWQWYALWAIFFLNVSAGLAIISDAKAMAASIGGASATLASAFVVMVAVADSTGRLFWPALSDRIGQSTVFLTMFLLQAAAFSLLPLLGAGSFAVFCALSFVALSCYGGGYGTMPALVNAYYGSRDVGTIYAGVITASGVAGFGAPLLLALTADATGSYGPALYVTAALMLVGAAIPLVLRPP